MKARVLFTQVSWTTLMGKTKLSGYSLIVELCLSHKNSDSGAVGEHKQRACLARLAHWCPCWPLLAPICVLEGLTLVSLGRLQGLFWKEENDWEQLGVTSLALPDELRNDTEAPTPALGFAKISGDAQGSYTPPLAPPCTMGTLSRAGCRAV